MAVTCWSYMAVRKLISLNRNASNFPWAIILCPQQNKRVIFLKMRELKSLIKATVNVVLLIADTAVFTSVFPVRWCVCVFLGRTWGEEGEGKGSHTALGKTEAAWSSANLAFFWPQAAVFSGTRRTLLVPSARASPSSRWLWRQPHRSAPWFYTQLPTFLLF